MLGAAPEAREGTPELLEELIQKGMIVGDSRGMSRRRWSVNTGGTPSECHGEGLEVPQDGTQRAEELEPQDRSKAPRLMP